MLYDDDDTDGVSVCGFGSLQAQQIPKHSRTFLATVKIIKIEMVLFVNKSDPFWDHNVLLDKWICYQLSKTIDFETMSFGLVVTRQQSLLKGE